MKTWMMPLAVATAAVLAATVEWGRFVPPRDLAMLRGMDPNMDYENINCYMRGTKGTCNFPGVQCTQCDGIELVKQLKKKQKQ